MRNSDTRCSDESMQKILHRDLKPGNIFLDSKRDAKVGDFGLARIMNQDSVFAQTHVGTPYYMSPEQISEQNYNEKSDIWSLGCIIYELCSLRPPFTANSYVSLAAAINQGDFARIPSVYSDELNKVIRKMITKDPAQRASIDELHGYPRIANILSASN